MVKRLVLDKLLLLLNILRKEAKICVFNIAISFQSQMVCPGIETKLPW
jgi:hypothetical protein